MPFLNPPDAIPEAMRFVIRLILAMGNAAEEGELVALLAPSNLRPESDQDRAGQVIVKATLTAMRSSELIEGGGREKPERLSGDVVDRFPTFESVTAEEFSAFVLDTVLRNAPVESDGDRGASDLARALAFIVTLDDPLTPLAGFDSGNGRKLQDELTGQFGQDNRVWPLRNKERYQALIRWAAYLGFGYTSTQGGFIVDPTMALHRQIAHLKPTTMPLDQFFSELGVLLPCCGVGPVSSSVRSSLAHQPENTVVVPGLALGLLRLHDQGAIQLSRHSDALATFNFVVSSAVGAPSFTHVRVGKES